MIVIDALVGAGKSTLLDILEKHNGYKSYPEPIINNPLLDKFYNNKKRYSFALQVFFFNKRFSHIKEANKDKLSVSDRSIYGDLIFAKVLNEDGDLLEEEYNIYLDLFNNMIKSCENPELLIYLEISTEEAIRRIKARGRSYEMSVDISYWDRINKNYQKYFDDNYHHSPILKINVNDLDFENNIKDKNYILDLINNKLEKIRKC